MVFYHQSVWSYILFLHIWYIFIATSHHHIIKQYDLCYMVQLASRHFPPPFHGTINAWKFNLRSENCWQTTKPLITSTLLVLFICALTIRSFFVFSPGKCTYLSYFIYLIKTLQAQYATHICGYRIGIPSWVYLVWSFELHRKKGRKDSQV